MNGFAVRLTLIFSICGPVSTITVANGLPSGKVYSAQAITICDVYGRGFYALPGSNTCLRIGGRIGFDLSFANTRHAWAPAAGGGGAFSAAGQQDMVGWRARAYLTMNARTQSAWATLHTYLAIALQSRSGIFNADIPGQPGGQSTASPEVQAAYIRFAGLTFGRAPWNFVHGPGHLFYGSGHSERSQTGVLQMAYTAVLGDGFLASIALEDQSGFAGQRSAPWTFTNSLLNATGIQAFAPLPWTSTQPNRLPNIVLTLGLERDWGYFRVSGAAGNNRTVFATGSLVTPLHVLRRSGWAIGASAKIRLPYIAHGDALHLFAAYSNGLNDYAKSGAAMHAPTDQFERPPGGYFPAQTNLGTYVCGLSAANAITRLCVQNTRTFAAMIAFTHHWTSNLRSSMALSYIATIPGNVSRNSDWFTQGGQPKSQAWKGAINLIWSPVKDFDIGMQISYTRIRNKLACGNGQQPVAGYTCTQFGSIAAPSTINVAQNPSDISLKLRVERAF